MYITGDVIITNCFLINGMSSSLYNKVPNSILFPSEPLFHISPRAFSFICFVHNMSLGLDKLSANAIKCVFKKAIDVNLLKPRGTKCISVSLFNKLLSSLLYSMFIQSKSYLCHYSIFCSSYS